MDLGIDTDDLNACVQCGLCLPHCPTYRVTGDEALSPRGRIHLMREVQDNAAPVTPEVVDAFDTCVQCRGCEPACPSGVPYGRLIESTRAVLADTGAVSTRRERLAFWALSRPRTLRLGSSLLAIAARLRLVPKRLGVPTDLPLTRGHRRISGDDVYLFTGCVMDAWQRSVHDAGQRVLEAAGVGVTPTGDLAPCCGALHTHAGLGGRSSWPVWLTVSGVKPSGRVPFGVVRPPDTRRLAGFSDMAERIGRFGDRFTLIRNHNCVILPTVVHRLWTTPFVEDQSSIGATRSMSSRQ